MPLFRGRGRAARAAVPGKSRGVRPCVRVPFPSPSPPPPLRPLPEGRPPAGAELGRPFPPGRAPQAGAAGRSFRADRGPGRVGRADGSLAPLGSRADRQPCPAAVSPLVQPPLAGAGGAARP